MTKQELQQLFKNEILPENENPYHFQEPQRASFTVEAYNSMCGDKYTLYFNTRRRPHHLCLFLWLRLCIVQGFDLYHV